jgi:chemotaxis family two-component system sensor kinase Cph1
LLVPKDSFWTKMSSYQNRELCVISTRKALTDIKLTQEECPASGIVFFQEGRTQIMIGRAMRSKDVVWAGNPDEPKLRIGGILNPRNSFTQFIEKARKESRAWTVQDISVISVLRDRICEHSYAYMMGLLRGDIQDANRKYLAAIDRARDNYEFFAHMSHELRTPFHGVMGCLSILHESIEDMPAAEVRDVVDTAIASGNHMINLLNDILDISKNKHLSHISAQDKVIYQTLAFETIDCMKSLATSRKIEMRSSIEPKGLEKVVIVTDRTKIIQIVSNVVNNAIKFTGEGTVDVVFRLVDSLQEATMMWERGAEVHAGSVFSMKESEMHTSAEEVRRSTMTFNETHDQKWMTMSVSDTGCGMEPCELVEMFSPYTQSSHGSNRIFQGTGLGLFICVSLCYQLNGFISCASTPDKGTLFHMGIPVGLLAEDTVEGNQTLTDDTKETESVIQMSGPILIVDDNVVNVKILNRALLLDIRRAGLAIEVLTAGGGAEGVQVFRDKRPSLCIIDYHMPDVDGIEATCTIRKYEQENKIDPTYILMYTADATEQARALILSSGVDDIMSKPPPKGFIAGLVQRLRVPE